MQNQRHISYSACVIGAGFVKGKVNRPEQIDDQPGYLEPENGTPCMNQKSAKDAFSSRYRMTYRVHKRTDEAIAT